MQQLSMTRVKELSQRPDCDNGFVKVLFFATV